MNGKRNRRKSFFNKLWHEIELSAIELCAYLILIIAVFVISAITDPLIPKDLKEIIRIIKSIVVIAALSLSAVNTISKMIIRVRKSIIKEIKDDDDDDNDDRDNGYDNGHKNTSQQEQLNPEPANFADSGNIQDLKQKKSQNVYKDSES